MDNNVFFKGKAIIDEQFNILSVDDELKDFLGDNLVNTKLARLIHPSDINQLEAAVKNAQSESGFVTALRMVDNTGRYIWFVYIIDEAEKMTVQAQNALLKTIEEPPEYAVILFLTNTLDVLLQTVRSRCIIMNLRSVDTKLIQQYLMQKYQLPDYQARVCAAYAQGNVGKAIMMATSEHFREMQDFLLRLLKRVDDMEVYEIVAAIHDMTTYKMDIRDLIDLMMVWYRDVLILKATEDINQLVYQDEHKYLQKKATTSSYEGLNNIMEALEKAKVRLNANVNFDITMEMLLLTIKEN